MLKNLAERANHIYKDFMTLQQKMESKEKGRNKNATNKNIYNISIYKP